MFQNWSLGRMYAIPLRHAQVADDELREEGQLKPMKMMIAPAGPHFSEYIRPVIFGHQK